MNLNVFYCSSCLLLVVLCLVPAKCDFFDDAKDKIKKNLKKKYIKRKAENVILFIGDGMSAGTIAATRILVGGEEHLLEFEKFPWTGIVKTYSVDDQVPESAATATALATGTKVNSGTLGVANTTYNQCGGEKEEHAYVLTTLLQYANQSGMATGIVTTARVTHATPAAFYAKSPNRRWENDYDIREDADGYNATNPECVDIAKQLVNDHPYINVVLGGGRRNFLNSNVSDLEYTDRHGYRDEGDLIQDWIDEKEARNVTYKYVWNETEFSNVDPTSTQYLLGLFERTHMMYENERVEAANPDPSLADMVTKAIEMLETNANGYFLVVEAARIDHAHHSSKAAKALDETVELDKAIAAALKLVKEKNTLIMVTADHAHSLTAGGWASRGNPITGKDDREYYEPDLRGYDRMTLAYHNGPNYRSRNLDYYDTESIEFEFQSAYGTDITTHSPFDVPVYCRGPFSHLCTGVNEQNYLAHVIAYASCLGDSSFRSFCNTKLYSKQTKT